METYKEFINEAVDKKTLIEFIKKYFDKYGNTYGEEGSDKNTYLLKTTGIARELMTLNTKTGMLKISVDKKYDESYYNMAAGILKNLKADYCYEYGTIDDIKIRKQIVMDAGISEFKDMDDKCIFRVGGKWDGAWYQLYRTGEIDKYNAKKNLDPKMKKKIQDLWKKERPNLKWYFLKY
jgi:hypothetical protein